MSVLVKIFDDLVITSKETIRLLINKGETDAMALYMFYNYTASWQKTDRPRATESFCMKGLGWGRDKFRKAKKVLKELNLINDVRATDDNGRFCEGKSYIEIAYIKFENSIENEEKPTGGKSGEREDENNLPTEKPTDGESVDREPENNLPTEKPTGGFYPMSVKSAPKCFDKDLNNNKNAYEDLSKDMSSPFGDAETEYIQKPIPTEKPQPPQKMNGAELVKYFCGMYAYYFRDEYIPSWQRDGAIMKKLFTTEKTNLPDLIDFYLNMGENKHLFWSTVPRTVKSLQYFINDVKQVFAQEN